MTPDALRELADRVERATGPDELPLGFDAACEDWNESFAGRQMTVDDWNRLTFGEQQRYGARECKTKGALYSVTVTGRTLHVTVDLPASLVGPGFTASEARALEHAAHRKLEETVHWLLVRRGQERNADAPQSPEETKDV